MRDNYWDFRFFESNGRKESVLYCISVIVGLFFDLFRRQKKFFIVNNREEEEKIYGQLVEDLKYFFIIFDLDYLLVNNECC